VLRFQALGQGAVTPTSKPRITALVTAHEDSPQLSQCLRTVQDQAKELGAEVLLVINAREESLPAASKRALERLCSRILFVETPGKSSALNEAVATCESEVIAFTDDDAQPQGGWLESLTAPLLDPQRPERLVGAGGRVLPIYPEKDLPDWYRRFMEDKPASILGPRYDLGPEPFTHSLNSAAVYPPIGANCAYRAEIFQKYRYSTKLGPNYETGLRGGEDTELGKRLLLDGFQLDYVPQALVCHPIHADRLGFEFCKQRFYSHGMELARLRNMLGDGIRSPWRLRWERRLLLALYIVLPFSSQWSRERIALQREKLRGMVHELQQSEASN
jgi:glycosyltransferase involved in cell wall biosynthesis